MNFNNILGRKTKFNPNFPPYIVCYILFFFGSDVIFLSNVLLCYDFIIIILMRESYNCKPDKLEIRNLIKKLQQKTYRFTFL
jgi:hypothetical protein